MGLPLQVTVTLTEINCGGCGGTYAINERYRKQREESRGHWMCPYCRTEWGYGQSENDRLKADLAAASARTQAALARANAEQAERQRAEAERDRLKKRAAAGVCPCCNRTFQQLAAHMATKHPDMVKGGSGKLPKTKRPPVAPRKTVSEFERAKAKHQAKHRIPESG